MSRVSTAGKMAREKMAQLQPTCECFTQGGVFETVLLGPVARPALVDAIQETIEALQRWCEAIEDEPHDQ